MIETKDIIKMVKHIVRHDNGVPDTRIMHPMREWLIGLCGVFALVLGGSLFAAFVYQSYSLRAASEVVTPGIAIPYKAALIEEVLLQYQAKQNAYDQILGKKLNEGVDLDSGTTTSSTVGAQGTSTNIVSPNTMVATTSTSTVRSLEVETEAVKVE